ncbi:hypothetical protein LCGC14_0812290 [marine sediment metagenome]|uniref:Helicase C-terminal domain-containing protein n=1 Tax=marine sediment metagenome TaxID=412755 RepID=A0A0F9S6B0_9ZZZZ
MSPFFQKTFSLDVSRCIFPPFKHQVIGTNTLVNSPVFALFDDMGVGKTKQIIDAACILFEVGQIDTVIVVCPSVVKEVWLDPEYGEIQKHTWVPSRVLHFHSQGTMEILRKNNKELLWVITNYAFLRQDQHLKQLIQEISVLKKFLVLDESSFIKSRTAQQTKACLKLRKTCARVVIVNGIPVASSPLDLWSQFRILHTAILPFRNFYHFRSCFAVMGGWQNRQIIKWHNLEYLQKLIKPWMLRRTKEECLDLPPKLYTTLEPEMTPVTYRLYKEMRDDMVAWLDTLSSVANQPIVKILRLAQLIGGFLGGVEEVERIVTVEVGREKLDALKTWLMEKKQTDPDLRVLIWCRFRRELIRCARELEFDPKLQFKVFTLCGGQTLQDRKAGIREFTSPRLKGPVAMVGQPQAGGFGLNFTSCHTVIYMSNDFNLLTRKQSEDRVHRKGQQKAVLYVDILARGPKGQKTIDHKIRRVLQKKEEIATWTIDRWRKLLVEDI